MVDCPPKPINEDVYEHMTGTSQDSPITMYSLKEDIYESMRELNPESAEDLCE